MLKINRQKVIEEELHDCGSILISDMSLKLDCSEETIRRDIREMEQDKKLTRIHGGAFLPDKYDKSVPIQLRENFFSVEKDRMSSYIIKNYIQEDDVIMLDCSTTCLTLAKQLLFTNMKLTIITNSLRICNLFSAISTNKVRFICLGGTLSRRSASYVGYQTTQALSGYLADKCFISCSAVDMKHGLVDNNLDEGQVRKAYVHQSRQCFLVADHAKFSGKADVIITGLEDLDVVITNKRLSQKWEQTLQDLNLSIEYC